MTVSQAPAAADTGAAVVLLSEQVVRVSSSGKVVTTERRAVRILRGDGSDEAVARVDYDASSDDVRDLAAWVIPPGGPGSPVPVRREADVAVLGEHVYNELRVRTIVAREEAVPGAVFGYEWIRESRQIFTQFVWTFQDERPSRISRFTLEVPKGWVAEGVMFHHPPITPSVDGTRYTWELRDLPGVADEPARPPLESLAPRLGVTCLPAPGTRSEDVVHFAGWADVARWLDQLAEPVRAPAPEVAARAREVVRGARSMTDTIRSVGRYVQSLRYVSIGMGLHRGGGYRPVPAATVLARGYGDCKAKANLMRSMLAALGIEAYLVAVHAGDPGYAEEAWPSPSSFNHCIVAVRTQEGSRSPATVRDSALGAFTLFDPTDPFVSFGDLPETIQGSLALVQAAQTRSPVRVPRLVGQSVLERRVSLDLREDGTVTGRLVDRAGGFMAAPLRWLVYSRGSRDRDEAIERWLTRAAGRTRITRIEASDDTVGDRTSLRVEFEAGSLGQAPQRDLLAFRPFLFPSVEGPLLALVEPRRHPIDLAARAMRETVVVYLPQGFRVDELPKAVSLQAPFGRYSASLRVTGGVLQAVRVIEMRAERLPASELVTARDFVQAIREFEETPVVLAR